MRIALTGAGGFVGRFIAQAALAAGHDLVLLSRRPLPVPGEHRAFDLLTPPPDLGDVDVLIHSAFHHVAGRFRGGEGRDPAGFLRANRDGTLRLFEAAAGRRILFLSSRAVFDGYPPGTPLAEDLPPRPTSLYAKVKLMAEAALAPHDGAILRATGVYGPGPDHKWISLFADFRAGRPIAPRAGSEVHGADLAAAVLLLLEQGTGVFHVSDLLVDRHDLLARVADLTGCPHPPPPRSAVPVSLLKCRRLPDLGWRPGGWARLSADLPALVEASLDQAEPALSKAIGQRDA